MNFGISGTSLLIGLPLAYHFCKIKDTTAGILGVLSRMAGLIFLGLSYSTEMMFICPVFFIFSDYALPAFRSILSKLVDPDETGRVFAAMASLQNVSFLTGAVFNRLYLVGPPYLSFELVAALQALALAVLLYLRREVARTDARYEEMNEEISESA